MRLFLFPGIIATALLVAMPALAQQEGLDMRLRSAGFKVRPATTPQELALLRRVPPRTMLSRSDQARRYYVYADPDYCKCVFVGDDVALRTFKDMPPAGEQPAAYSSSRPSTTEILIREMDADLGQTDIFGPPF
jgi:hypothetical protein